MKKILFILLICCVSTYLFANIKAAFIDWQLITDKHPIAQKKFKELEAWASPYKIRIKGYEQTLMALEKDYEENLMASDKIKQEKEVEYKKTAMDYRNYLKEFRERLRVKESELLPEKVQLKISNDLLDILKRICLKKGFNVIYDRVKNGAVYVDESIDITKEVIDELSNIKLDDTVGPELPPAKIK